MLWPRFDERVIEETDGYVVKINHHGAKVRNLKDETSMPEFLEYPIQGPRSLDWLRERLDPRAPGRTSPDWLATARCDQGSGRAVFSNGGSYFGFLNEHMGTERLMTAYFDAPDFVHAVNDMLCVLCEQALRTVLPEFALDFVGYHEDMAYRNGSIISPEMFGEFMSPYYRRVRDAWAPHGVDVHIMDSDGDIRQLIPLWLDCGVNVFTPMEVAAGMDVLALREQYGRQIGMMGGFDKRILAAGRGAIRAEVERLRPVIEEGGYVPSCDHGVPPDVPWDHYKYFVDCLKTVYGIR